MMTLRSYRIRIFLTCWVIFSLHFATDFVREHYNVISLADHASYRLDGYEDMHPDIFMTKNHGAHHGANPGASILATVPYLIFKPIVDKIHKKVIANRAASGNKVTAVYKDPRPDRVKFYKQARERGLDIKFGLVGFITQVTTMGPLSALSAVVIFSVFIWLGLTAKTSTWLALIYAVATPVLFRTGFLNQNIMVGIFSLFAFVLVWRPYTNVKLGYKARYILAGFLAGLGLLCDYSGVITLGLIGIYVWIKRSDEVGVRSGFIDSWWYVLGALAPVLVLWHYQYVSFGSPFYPGQHYMPPVEWIEIGYKGFGFPEWKLLKMLWFDMRFGLFTSGPVLLLGLYLPVLLRSDRNILPKRETMMILAIIMAMSIFFSAVQYTQLQYYTGIRYLMAIVPLMFILVGVVLVKIPKAVAYSLILLSLTVSWSTAMIRSQEGIIDSILRVFLEGFQLPWMATLSRMATQYLPGLEGKQLSALPFMIFTAAIIYGIWAIKLPAKSLISDKVS